MNSTSPRLLYLGWLDYVLFILTLASSMLIGLYFGVWGKKITTAREYLYGGGQMSLTPVAVSLIVSFVSGISMLGMPADVYLFGSMMSLYVIPLVFMGLATYFFYLPVFYELKIGSAYEYLQLRFNRPVRVMVSALWTIDQILRISITVQISSLTFSQVTGVDEGVMTPVVSIICTVYTMMGGIKAVVWTDLLQGVVMLASSLAVVILGVQQVGGLGAVWQRSQAGDRIQFEISPSMYERMTLWNVGFCHIFYFLGFSTLNQAMVQRYLSLPSFSKAGMAVLISTIGTGLLLTLSSFTGLVIYSQYFDCDPLKSKVVQRPDQILPYFVMDVSSQIPGLPGLFIAGIFSATLSTMSSCLNALSATIFEDFIHPCLKSGITEKSMSRIVKFSVAVLGVVTIFVAFVTANLGNVMQILVSSGGITTGATVGVFTFGMFFPRGNSKGALAGCITSFIIMGWIVIGSQVAIVEHQLRPQTLNLTVEGCSYNVTTQPPTTSSLPPSRAADIFFLYRISFQHYSFIGTVIMVVVATVVSLLTEEQHTAAENPVLLTPIVRKIVKKRYEQMSAQEVTLHSLLHETT